MDTSFNLRQKTTSTHRKRPEYNFIPDERKEDLIFRTVILREKLRIVCSELKINFLTGRNIIQHYKKTGKITHSGRRCRANNDTTKHQDLIGDSSTKIQESPLGIIITDTDTMKLVNSRFYTEEDVKELMKLDHIFRTKSIV